jgi:hypothetical protein
MARAKNLKEGITDLLDQTIATAILERMDDYLEKKGGHPWKK